MMTSMVKQIKSKIALLTEWRRMGPEAGLCAHNARLSHQLVTVIAGELHGGAHVVVRALVHQAAVHWGQRRWAKHRCKQT